MEQLEALFEEKHPEHGIVPRKTGLAEENTLLTGPSGSGKSWLMFDRMAALEKGSFLYVDMEDPRIQKERLVHYLPAFLEQKKIRTFLCDNYDGSFPLPASTVNLASVRTPLALEGYQRLDLLPLDFEEYMAFHRKHVEVTQLFNHYLRSGGLPEVANLPEERHLPLFRHRLEKALPDPTLRQVFAFFLEKSGFRYSLHQVYTALKEQMKISKDKLYAGCDGLEASGMLHYVPKLDQSKAAKKVYPYDFGLRRGVTFHKNFAKTYETMIFLELARRRTPLFFTETADFYLPEKRLAVLAVPFASEGKVRKAARRVLKETDALRIEAVTMGFGFEGEENGVGVHCLPFWEWALEGE